MCDGGWGRRKSLRLTSIRWKNALASSCNGKIDVMEFIISLYERIIPADRASHAAHGGRGKKEWVAVKENWNRKSFSYSFIHEEDFIFLCDSWENLHILLFLLWGICFLGGSEGSKEVIFIGVYLKVREFENINLNC